MLLALKWRAKEHSLRRAKSTGIANAIKQESELIKVFRLWSLNCVAFFQVDANCVCSQKPSSEELQYFWKENYCGEASLKTVAYFLLQVLMLTVHTKWERRVSHHASKCFPCAQASERRLVSTLTSTHDEC